MIGLLALGILLIGIAGALHLLVIQRVQHAQRVPLIEVIFKGGSLDYGHYLRARKRFGWSIWPIPMTIICLLTGVASIIAALING
jgi:hypothetical protein